MCGSESKLLLQGWLLDKTGYLTSSPKDQLYFIHGGGGGFLVVSFLEIIFL